MKWQLALIGAFFLVGCTLIDRKPDTPRVTPTLPGPQVLTNTAPNPEVTARRFLDAWKARDYETMYSLLSPLTQDGLTLEDFAKRYEEVWRNAALSGIDYEIVATLTNPRQAQVRYTVTMHSVAVDAITRETWMDLTRVEDEWRVAWSESTIMPELGNGATLSLNVVTPTRANIYDRNGLALVTQTDAVSLWLVPNQVGDEDAEVTMLSVLRRLLDYPSDESIQVRYDPIRSTDFRVNLGEVSLEAFQQVEDTLGAVGGVQWGIYPTRFYFDRGLASHVVGYVSWIPEESLDEYLARGYRQDEYVGQIGLEARFEEELRGRSGGSLYLVDPGGQTKRALASRESEPPYAVYTTLDRDLQRYAQQAIEDEEFAGAVIVMERDTGAVLAIASTPSFDPNLFDAANPNSSSGISELFQSTNSPLLNRATSGLYPLGSVFKIITMAAALESGFYDPDTVYNCGLEFRELPGVVLDDWRKEKELGASGEITLIGGLERSCNPYFYHIGLDLYNRGLSNALSDMAKGFGLGQPTGIEIEEAAGDVPVPGNAREGVDLAIGQSRLQVTPLQVARYVAAVGNGGTLYRPQLVRRIQSAEGDIRYEFKPDPQGTLPVSEEHLQAIQQAMTQVVKSPTGTAYRRFLGLDVNVAGKTGTAQTGEFTEPHAWFAGYTFEGRTDKPDIAVVVLLEFQGEGSDWAAPVFRRVVEAYFKGRPLSVYPWEARIRVRKTPTPTPGPEDVEPEGTPTPET